MKQFLSLMNMTRKGTYSGDITTTDAAKEAIPNI